MKITLVIETTETNFKKFYRPAEGSSYITCPEQAIIMAIRGADSGTVEKDGTKVTYTVDRA